MSLFLITLALVALLLVVVLLLYQKPEEAALLLIILVAATGFLPGMAFFEQQSWTMPMTVGTVLFLATLGLLIWIFSTIDPDQLSQNA